MQAQDTTAEPLAADRSTIFLPMTTPNGQQSAATRPLNVHIATRPEEFVAIHMLRGQRFHPDAPDVPDTDRFDPLCQHLMVADRTTGVLLATARVRLLSSRSDFDACYTAQSYDIGPIAQHFSPALEIGRLCVTEGPDASADVFRALLGGLTAFAVRGKAQVLTGCASFHGADVARHAGALSYLNARHLGPLSCRPLHRAAESVLLSELPPSGAQAARDLPPLLRMYLAMGGWVSDHAVIDRSLNTLHVLVAVPVSDIPPARMRALGALLGAVPLSLD